MGGGGGGYRWWLQVVVVRIAHCGGRCGHMAAEALLLKFMTHRPQGWQGARLARCHGHEQACAHRAKVASAGEGQTPGECGQWCLRRPRARCMLPNEMFPPVSGTETECSASGIAHAAPARLAEQGQRGSCTCVCLHDYLVEARLLTSRGLQPEQRPG